jgi:diguanylate cyclase (GGDEF)-like protein
MIVDNSISNRPITDKTVTVLSIIAHTVGMAINNSKLYLKTLDVAIRDPLTGLHNRRYFNERLLDEVERASRYAEHLSLVICDIDHFKKINDSYGHPAGDTVLCGVADTLRNNIRKNDIVSRYGGEEFAMLLLNTEKAQAAAIAEKIRRAFEEGSFSLNGGDIRLTLSFGLSSFGVDSSTFEGLISCADQALYSAKARGRNMVCCQ